jgi:hypothetical protein
MNIILTSHTFFNKGGPKMLRTAEEKKMSSEGCEREWFELVYGTILKFV